MSVSNGLPRWTKLGADTLELRWSSVSAAFFFSVVVDVVVGVMAYDCSVVVTKGCRPAALSSLVMMVAIVDCCLRRRATSDEQC